MKLGAINNNFSTYSHVGTNLKKKDGISFQETLNQEKAVRSNTDNYLVQSTQIASNQVADNPFSGDYQERLTQIEQLNEDTNWDSMSDEEKVKVFYDRYSKAFPDFVTILSGIYTPYSSKYTQIGDHYTSEYNKYFAKGGKAPLQTVSIEKPFRKAYYGDMTDGEICSVIMDKYSSSDTMESKNDMLYELIMSGVATSGEYDLQHAIGIELYKQTESTNKAMFFGTSAGINQHPRFLELYVSYAKGIGIGSNYRPTWAQIITTVKNSLQPAEGTGNSNSANSTINAIKDDMDNFLNEILGRESV